MSVNNRDKVLIIGYFGYRSGILEGQSVKTRNVSRLLGEMGCIVSEFDTESVKYSKRAVFELWRMLVSADKVCILPAYNSLKWIVPAVYVLSHLFRYKMYLFTIGGRLHIYLKDMPLHRHILGRIGQVFSETHLLKKNLEESYGYSNVTYCPNFKFFGYRQAEVVPQDISCLRLVFLARITAEKGLDVIFSYCQYLLDCGKMNVSIDFYGMIDEKDRSFFEQNIEKYPFANYKGVVEQNEITGILKKYDALLFPTHFPTEGIPGSVLDAYIAGIPVIASNWKYASELIDDGRTGIVVPFNDNVAPFIDACESLLKDGEKLSEMKKCAYEKGLEYNADSVKKILNSFFC